MPSSGFPFERPYDGPIEVLGSSDGHSCYLYFDMKGDGFRAKCSCGEEWTYGSISTMEDMQSIYESHLQYFNHKKMETL